MIKLILILLVFTVTGSFAVNKITGLKEKVVEYINPAIKEGRILGELKENLSQLSTNITEISNIKNLSELKAKSTIATELIDKSKGLLNDVSKINEENSGFLRQTVGNVIRSLTDKTPFPADHLKLDGTPIIIPIAGGTPLVCP